MLSALNKRILIIDDDHNILEGLKGLLEVEEWEVATADRGRDGFLLFESFAPDLVLLDVSLPDYSGLDILNRIKSDSEGMPVIMMSGAGTIEMAIESMKTGAETFLQKPFDYDTLRLTLQQADRLISTRREMTALRRGVSTSAEQIPGISLMVRDLNILIERVASAPSSVLIEGESGTGKGYVARLIHNLSNRARSPFVDLNCAGLSKELLESELFGHEKGSFTSATSTKPGLFEIGANGTVFLDEIGELDIGVQARLLKALEDKKFRRVGGVRDLEVDFRLVAATNRNLAKDVSSGRFRADLYYRLNVVQIRVPPLRERLEDVPILTSVLLERLAREVGRPVPRLTERALRRLQGYAWPGNIRELRNVLERALIISREKGCTWRISRRWEAAMFSWEKILSIDRSRSGRSGHSRK